jgi:hypothetical protein
MGGGPTQEPIVSGLTSRAIDFLSRQLDPDERDAVCGDLAEAGTTPLETVRELTGLIFRREALRWRDWRPWLAVAGIVAPLGLLLSLMSRYEARVSAIYGWIYLHNWTWGVLQSPGARLDLLQYGGSFVVSCLAMLCWAWAAGYVLGLLSGRSVWLTGTLFILMLFAGTAYCTTTAIGGFNGPVFSQAGYRVFFPLALRIFVVLLPAVHGMSRARRRPAMRPREALLWLTIVGSLTFLVAGRLEGAVAFGWWTVSSRFAFVHSFARGQHVWPWAMHLLPLAIAWPVAFILVRAISSQSATLERGS